MAEENSGSAASAEAISSALNTQASTDTFNTAATHQTQANTRQSEYPLPNTSWTTTTTSFYIGPVHSSPISAFSQHSSHSSLSSSFYTPHVYQSTSHSIPSNAHTDQSQYYIPRTSWTTHSPAFTIDPSHAIPNNPFSQPQSDTDRSRFYIHRVSHIHQNVAHTYRPADFDTIPSHSLPNPLLSQPQSHTEQIGRASCRERV